jgi:hypothetical protein
MRWMGKSRAPQTWIWGVIWALAVACAGCSHQSSFRPAEAQGQDVPFHQDAGDPREALAATASKGSEVPFDNSPSVTLPAGTLLSVRLERVLYGAKRDSGGEFSAVVDAPVTINGSVVLAPGTAVKGRVECAHVPKTGLGAGFVCLTLDSVRLGGKAMAIQTSSLFAKGVANRVTDGKANGGATRESFVVELGTGHRLTFRLSKAAVLARPQADDASAGLSQGSR